MKPGGVLRDYKTVEKKEINGRIQYTVRYYNEAEFREHYDRLKKKPNLISEEVIKTPFGFDQIGAFEHIVINFHTGTEDVLKAVLKIALNMALHFEIPIQFLSALIAHVQGPYAGIIVNPFYRKDKIKIIETEPTLRHSVLIKSFPQTKELFAYIELFQSYKYLVQISNNFLGPDLEYSYHLDFLKGTQLNRDAVFPYLGPQPLNHPPEIEEVKKANKELMVMASKLTLEKYIGTELATDLFEYKKGDIVTRALIDKFANDIIDLNSPSGGGF